MLFFLLILMSTRDVCCLEMMQRSVSGCTVLLQCKYCYRNSQTFIWSGWTQQSLKRCHYYCGATSVYRGSLDVCVSAEGSLWPVVFSSHIYSPSCRSKLCDFSVQNESEWRPDGMLLFLWPIVTVMFWTCTSVSLCAAEERQSSSEWKKYDFQCRAN